MDSILDTQCGMIKLLIQEYVRMVGEFILNRNLYIVNEESEASLFKVAEFTPEEIQYDIEDMGHKKAPGEDDLTSTIPVSYTHLDVYKRQPTYYT